MPDNNQDPSPEPTPTPDAPTTPTPPVSDAPTGAAPPSTETEHMIPKSRFDEINKNYKRAAAELKKLQRDKATAESAELEAQGQWKTLAEQNAAKTADLEAQLAEREAALQAARRNTLALSIAAQLGVIDPTDANVQTAVVAIDIAADDAEAQIRQALEALKETRSYLFGTVKPNLAPFNPSGQPQDPLAETDDHRRARIQSGSGDIFADDNNTGGVIWPRGKPD